MGNILHGARAKLGFYDGSQFTPVGIFSDVSWSVANDIQAAWILGRYTAADTEVVGVELVQVTATGYRVFGHSWTKDAKFPKLEDIANSGYLTMALYDRQHPNGPCIGEIKKLRPASASVSFTPRMLSSVTHTYIGILYSDENAPNNDEDSTAMEMPSD
jgi:hypothetical protein